MTSTKLVQFTEKQIEINHSNDMKNDMKRKMLLCSKNAA